MKEKYLCFYFCALVLYNPSYEKFPMDLAFHENKVVALWSQLQPSGWGTLLFFEGA